MSKQPPIFHIEKDNSKLYSVKLSNLQKNISLLSSLNNISNAQPRSSCSLFQTNSGVNYSDNSVFGLMDNTYDYSFENGKHNSSDSFLLFPQIDDEHKTQDFSSLFKTDEFKGSKNTLQSYFNADYMISTNRECEDIKEENILSRVEMLLEDMYKEEQLFSIEDNIVVFPDASWVTDIMYYSSSKEEGKLLNPEATISAEYIENNNEYAEKIISISNDIIVYDLIKRTKEDAEILSGE